MAFHPLWFSSLHGLPPLTPSFRKHPWFVSDIPSPPPAFSKNLTFVFQPVRWFLHRPVNYSCITHLIRKVNSPLPLCLLLYFFFWTNLKCISRNFLHFFLLPWSFSSIMPPCLPFSPWLCLPGMLASQGCFPHLLASLMAVS